MEAFFTILDWPTIGAVFVPFILLAIDNRRRDREREQRELEWKKDLEVWQSKVDSNLQHVDIHWRTEADTRLKAIEHRLEEGEHKFDAIMENLGVLREQMASISAVIRSK